MTLKELNNVLRAQLDAAALAIKDVHMDAAYRALHLERYNTLVPICGAIESMIEALRPKSEAPPKLEAVPPPTEQEAK